MVGKRVAYVGAALAVVALPQIGQAGSASAVFAPVAAVVSGGTGVFYLLAVMGVLYGAVKTILEVINRREEGNWVWYGVGTLATAAIAFVIVPAAIAPGVAAGATPQDLAALTDLVRR
jgi:hypothetical protein